MDAFFEQQKICPICLTKFNVTRVRSSACFVTERESDFQVKYRDVNPLLYSIWVCPNCQYANTDKVFAQDLKPQEIERLKKGLSLLRSKEPDFSGQRTLQTALRAFELAIRTATIIKSPAIILAGLYLRTAWIYRELGETKKEMKYLEQARKLYQHSFENESGHYQAKMSDLRIMYLIAELYRRTGKYEEAMKWFSRTVMNKDIKKEPEINRLVRDQWENAREEYKKQPAGTSDAPTAVRPDRINPEKPSDKSEEKTTAVVPPKSRGGTVKMFLSLYMDQVNWLKNAANKAYEKHQVFIEKETVARAVIDAFMQRFPDLGEFKSEEELKKTILDKFPV